MLGMIHLCYLLFLVLIWAPISQSSERYLILKVSDTAEEKVNKIIVTCKENCSSESPVDGMIKLKLPQQIPAGASITLEIVKHSDHPDWMLVSPPDGHVPAPPLDGKSDHIVSVTVVRIGREDPDNAQRLDGLARRYFTQAKYAEAEVLCKKVLEINEKIFGPERAETAESLRNLAFIYQEQKRYAEAEGLYERAIKICEKTSPEQPETAEILISLAFIYHHQEKYDDIAPLYKRAFDIYEKALGLERPETQTCFKYLVKLYTSNSQYEELEQLYKHALEFYERKGVGMMSDKRLNNMIDILERYGEFIWQDFERTHRGDEAMRLLGRAYDLKEKAGNQGANARPDAKRQFRRYICTLGHYGLPKEIPFELREYKHPLLSKYLPDYTFYVPYVVAHPAIYDEEDKTLKFDKSEGWYSFILGIADRENHLAVFNNVVPEDHDRKCRSLVDDFLIKARIKRFSSARTDNEMREITRMFLILNCLKGHGGLVNIETDKNGHPIVRDFETSEFKVKSEGAKTTVSYHVEDDNGILECYLTFDRQGNITGGKASGAVKASWNR